MKFYRRQIKNNRFKPFSATLMVGVMILFTLFSIGFVSAASTIEAHGISLPSFTELTAEYGMRIQVKGNDITLTKITQHASNTATIAFLRNSDFSYNESVLFVGQDAVFNVILKAGQKYYVGGGSNGSTYTLYYNDAVANGVFNVSSAGFNWTGAYKMVDLSYDNRAYGIISIDVDTTTLPSGFVNTTLLTPANGLTFTYSSQNFTAAHNSTYTYNITNATYHIWNSTGLFNSTTYTITGQTNTTNHTVHNFIVGSYHWNVNTCGNNGTTTLCNYAPSNYTFTKSVFTELSTVFNTSVVETSKQGFRLNVTATSIVSSAVAKLWYNGTSYTSSITDGTGSFWTAVNNFDIPLTPSTTNKTFWWEWTFVLTDGSTLKQNTSIQNQQVNLSQFNLCNTTLNVPYLNFTTKSAGNPFPVINASFKSIWEWWLGDGTIKRNISYEDVSETNSSWAFCLSPSWKNYNSSASIEIDGKGYAKNFHYLSNALISNNTNNISLYLLNDSDATLTILEVQDENQNPIENVIIQIQLYDIGSDTFYTIGMAKTSFNGEDTAYLNWYDSLYKFILIQNGVVIKNTNPYKIIETPQIFKITTTIAFPYDKFGDIIYSLYFNNATKNFVLTFTKPSGLITSGCLRVIKRGVTNDTQICNICETSTSATLYCNIDGYGNGTYIASFYATGSVSVIDWVTWLVGTTNVLYDLIGQVDGTIYAILFAGVVTMMLLISPVLGIIGILLGIIGAAALGFQPIDYQLYIVIVITGGVVIWLLKR